MTEIGRCTTCGKRRSANCAKPKVAMLHPERGCLQWTHRNRCRPCGRFIPSGHIYCKDCSDYDDGQPDPDPLMLSSNEHE